MRRVVVSLFRTTLEVHLAATSGPARRLETTPGCWSTATRVGFFSRQERGSIQSVSLCTKWHSGGSNLSKRRLCLQPRIGYVPETCCGRRRCIYTKLPTPVGGLRNTVPPGCLDSSLYVWFVVLSKCCSIMSL